MSKKGIKRRGISLIICLMIVCSFIEIRAYAKSNDWDVLYQNFLKENPLSFSGYSYALLDKGSAPELVTDEGFYTIENGDVKKIECHEEYVSVDYYWEKGNCFYYSDGDAESDTIRFFSIKNGIVKQIKRFDQEFNRKEWIIDGKKVTEKKYKRAYSKIIKKHNKKYGKAKKIVYSDYTRYHYNDMSPHFFVADTVDAKIFVDDDLLIIKGNLKMSKEEGESLNCVSGKEHVFKFSSAVEFNNGEMIRNIEEFKQAIKGGGFTICFNQKEGVIVDVSLGG